MEISPARDKDNGGFSSMRESIDESAFNLKYQIH